jgi:hypothetical protein
MRLPGDERQARDGVGRKAAATGTARSRRQDQMSLKKLGVALLTVFALGAFMASSAFATNNWSENNSQWYVGGEKLTEKKYGKALH